MSEKFLIWSNEHNAWWKAASMGYTVHIQNAGRYSLEEAIKICNGANYSWDMDRKIPFELPIAESAALLLSTPRISPEIPSTITAEEVAAMCRIGKVRQIHLRNCSMCNYPLSYLIEDDKVSFDAGCDCVNYRDVRERSWGDIAGHYNAQGSSGYKASLLRKFRGEA